MKIDDISVLDLATDPRGTLGETVPFFFYRYVTFAVADSMGTVATGALETAGRKVGEQLVKGMFYRTLANLAEHYQQHGMGVLEVEAEADDQVRLRLRDCATCTGLPPMEMPLCWFDGGLLAGAVGAMKGRPFDMEEVECAGLGGSSCLFELRAVQAGEAAAPPGGHRTE